MTVGKWAVLPKGCRTESNNMFPNLSVLALLPKNAYFLLVGANLPPRLIPSLLLLIQLLDFIFYKILPALNIMMTADFLLLPKAVHLFIYLLLKPLSSKLLPTKRIHIQLKDCTLIMLSHWSYSCQSRLGFSL